MNRKHVLILLIHAFVLWGICGEVMGIGMAVFSLRTVLIIHGSLDMFKSFIGTWLPFTLIFSSTYLTGILWDKSGKKTLPVKET